MDILTRIMSQLRVDSQSSSCRTADTPKSRHSRKVSYEEAITPSTVDYIVALIAGSDAKFRLERKRLLVYFQSLKDTPTSTSSENWADAAGGQNTGIRESLSSFRPSLADPSTFVTYRYRTDAPTPCSSCTTDCTTIEHYSPKPSVASTRSSFSTFSKRPTLSKRPSSNKKVFSILKHPERVPEEKLSTSQRAGSFKQVRFEDCHARKRASYQPPTVEDITEEEVSPIKSKPVPCNGTRSESNHQHPAAEDDTEEETADYKTYPVTSISVQNKSCYQKPATEDVVEEKAAPLKSSLIPCNSFRNKSNYRRPAAEDFPEEEAANFNPYTTTYNNARSKPNYLPSTAEYIAEVDVAHFNAYPNTFKCVKDPLESRYGDQRRQVRPTEYFHTTGWKTTVFVFAPCIALMMKYVAPWISPHTQEFKMIRDFNPLSIYSKIDPQHVAARVKAKEKLMRQSRREGDRSVLPVFRPLNKSRPGRPQTNRRYTAPRPAPKSQPAARPAVKRTATAPAIRGRQCRSPVKTPAKAADQVEKDQGCAIESDTEEEDMEASAEWDPICYIEPKPV